MDSEKGKEASKRAGTQKKRSTGKIRGQGHPKDTSYSLLFEDNANFAEVFNKTVLHNTPISPDCLTKGNTRESAYLSVTDGTHTLLTLYRDVLKELSDGTLFALLGIENQSDVDYTMPLRVLAMEFINYARQTKAIEDMHKRETERVHDVDTPAFKASDTTQSGNQQDNRPEIGLGKFKGGYGKTDRLIPCITLVLYWGTEEWDGARDLSVMFFETPWTPYASNYEMNLLDIRHMPREQLESFEGELKAVFGAARYAGRGDGGKYTSDGSKILDKFICFCLRCQHRKVCNTPLLPVWCLNGYQSDSFPIGVTSDVFPQLLGCGRRCQLLKWKKTAGRRTLPFSVYFALA